MYCTDSYRNSEIKWILDNANKYTNEELTIKYNEKHSDRKRTESALKNRIGLLRARNKIDMKHIPYTKEENEWPAKNFRDMRITEITNKFNRKFNSNRTKEAIRTKLRTIRFIYGAPQESPTSFKKQRELDREKMARLIENGTSTLCWLCDKAAIECSYDNGKKPVKNWVATESKLNFRGKYGNEETISHCVHRCPDYIGSLGKGYNLDMRNSEKERQCG